MAPNCLQLAPFGFVTPTGQISTFFLDDLKKLAYYMQLSVFQWLYEFGLDVLLGIDVKDVKKDKKYFRRDFTIRGLQTFLKFYIILPSNIIQKIDIKKEAPQSLFQINVSHFLCLSHFHYGFHYHGGFYLYYFLFRVFVLLFFEVFLYTLFRILLCEI